MSHSNDFKLPGSFSIYQIEREAMEKVTPRAVNIPWPHLGVFGYCVDGLIELGKVGVCGRGTSLTIPPGCRLCLGNSLRMDVYVP